MENIVLCKQPLTVAKVNDLRGKGYSADFECVVHTHTVDGAPVFVGAGAFNAMEDAEKTALRIFNNWWSA